MAKPMGGGNFWLTVGLIVLELVLGLADGRKR